MVETAETATTTPNAPPASVLPGAACSEADRARHAADGCTECRDALVENHLPFVHRVAREFRGLGLPREDLVHEGTLGLLEAVRRFDADRGFRFLTFASWWIRKSMRVALRRGTGTVAVPGYQRRQLREIRAAEVDLCAELGRRPDEHELSRRLGRSVSGIRRTVGRRRQVLRIDAPVGESGNSTWAQLLPDPAGADPESGVLRDEVYDHLRKELESLGRREFDILRWRYGLGDHPACSLQEISERIGLSRERIRQIEVEVKARLRRRLLRVRLAPVD